MKQKHLVSVVLPTYNGSKWLSQSIDSILKQTYRNLELIIVDDASTDSTPELIMSFASRDPRIRIISHKSNKKLPQSLNDGFAIANGDYFTWTSDDNWYEPTAIEEMVTALTNSKYDMVIADLNKYQDDSTEQAAYKFGLGEDLFRPILFKVHCYDNQIIPIMLTK